MDRIVDFFFETGILQQIQRSGIPFLGSGNQTIASHVFRTTVIGYILAKMKNINPYKVVLMCLFHDIEESRTGDLNYLQQKYVKSDDIKALNDVIKDLPGNDEIASLIKEFEEGKTLEAQLAKDADTIELLLFLKENLDNGNNQAANWIKHIRKRLITDIAKELAEEILVKNYFDWWYNIDTDWSKGSKRW
ncbi:HD domain-containing protein [Deferribacter autotrophicus]|nr:HD domain-containing protein [Deferribacter autotrophicus]